MKKLFLTVMLVFSVALFAQHGRGGGGRPADAGGGKMNSGSDHGRSGDSHGDAGMSGKKTPDQLLQKNTKLSAKLEKLLPSGTTAQQACSGFKNLGQCVAAIHVSHNLNIPFDQLKAKLTGTSPESLGKAIHELKPDADSKQAAKTARQQADDDLDSSKG